MSVANSLQPPAAMAYQDVHPESSSPDASDRERRISDRAFQRYQARGGEDGHDMEDWLEAEREEELAAQTFAPEGLRQSGDGDGQVRQDRNAENREGHARTTPRYSEGRQLR
jgi:Protein of unknown function (DUF2934)